MNRKKLVALIMVLALAFTTLVGGTLAYFTDDDSAVNTMTLGNVKIEQHEKERTENGVGDFTHNKVMMPAVYLNNDYSSKEDITIGEHTFKIRDKVKNFLDKIVYVENTGKSDVYVRTLIAFPEAGDFNTTYNASEQWLHWNGVSDTDTEPANGWIWGRDKTTEWPGNVDNWDVVENVTIDGKVYDVYVATNKNPLASGKTTAPTLLGLFLDKRVDCEVKDDGTLNYTFGEYNLGDISKLEVLTLSQAVQTAGFDDAWTALDEAFGDVNAANAKAWFEEILP